ncbi:cytochrome P450 61 [Metarhizium album ARSEF 1941]|uniref:sterol 22-desaturase n=1 Tax=Metarhizium album (strain ARSEF 1941) TaxID=1081103 RepID=A0A0B2WWA2_METAS|nr:cytochrome P450 61 [Metarhizium album ARSEF 1941]KHN97884.1 cytochrome P450 61 [Metarhizium album ARSEF 1941]
MEANSSSSAFPSILASSKYGSINVPPQLDMVLEAVSTAGPWTILLTLLAMCVVYDQISYIMNKGSIVGPALKMPFIGPFLQSVNPKFEEYYAKWASGPLSCVSVFHKFVVIASTRDMARKVLNSPMYVKPCVVDVAHKLLGHDNWVFLDGKAHVDFRKGLNGLFTRKALECYLPGQEEVYKTYFQKFLGITKKNNGKPVPFMPQFRELMCAVSCRTFVGHYMSDAAVKKIADDYYLITAALELVNFPIIVPFTKTWYGKKAADMVLVEFAKSAAKSKVRMAAGGEVTCVMDGWILQMIQSERWRKAQENGEGTEGAEKPSPLLRMFSDYEISQTVFTFLFASQDATSSAATWLFQVTAQRPDVLDRVREENMKIRKGDPDAEINMDELESLTYTRAVVRELLRYRPPVLMVPYMVKKAFPITDSYTVPKGSMVVPTTYMALHDPEVYENPDYFDPDRYYSGDAEVRGAKNYLVFGTGPHYCLGQVYAQLNLALMIGKASVQMKWTHHPTPLSEEIKVFATIFPKDDCPLTFEKRQW